jgi:hypothetical protein
VSCVVRVTHRFCENLIHRMLAAVAASVISESRVRTGPPHLVRHARRHHCPAPVESPSSLPCFPWMAAGLAPFFHELLVFVLAPMECTDKRAKSQHRRSLERRLIGLVGSPAQESLAAFVGSRAQRVLGWRHAVCRAGGKTIGVREVDIFPCKKKMCWVVVTTIPTSTSSNKSPRARRSRQQRTAQGYRNYI